MLQREILDFLIHLRPHYQAFILSGGYLAGILLAEEPDLARAGVHFLWVQMLLFGGATAYNSYFDKDEGPIGGLMNPPKMKPWMHPVSLLVQVPGLLIGAAQIGWDFAAIYASSMLLFWLYSTPRARWKGHPVLSFIAVAVSTGTNSVLLGHLAAGGSLGSISLALGAVGVACVLSSMYPVSQVFQIAEDTKRGDRTFAVVHGLAGIRRFFALAYPLGIALLTAAFWQKERLLALVFLAVSTLAFLGVRRELQAMTGSSHEYRRVMRLKYLTSFLFNAFLLGAISAFRFI